MTTWFGDFAILCLHGGVNVDIDWGDGEVQTVIGARTPEDGPLEHVFATTADTHQVVVTGTFERLGCPGVGPELLKSVDEWGPTGTTDLSGAFVDTWNLTSVAEPPATVTVMTDLFVNSALNQPIGHWDTSRVTAMDGMFEGSWYDHPLDAWDMSNVTTMASMFSSAMFDQPIGSWNTSNVTDLSWTFAGANFNQPIGGWDTSNVTTMNRMFGGSAFDQPIGSWDTSSVTDMRWMFHDTRSFNRDLSSWCVAKIPTKPEGFDLSATGWTRPRPTWGTCSEVDRTAPVGRYSWKVVDRGRLWTRGEATDNVAVDKVRLSFQDRVTGRWLRRDGTLGEYQWFHATLDNPGARVTDWRFNRVLPKGEYDMRLVVIDSSDNRNPVPRPRRTVVIP